MAEAALWLQAQGAEVLEVRREEGRNPGPWRVYLPPFASGEEAQAKLREIRSRGVRDVAVIRDGELANGVSFGVYREAANVQRRVAALDRLGYAVRSWGTEAAPLGGYELEARTRGAAAAFEADWASRFPERPAAGRGLRLTADGHDVLVPGPANFYNRASSRARSSVG